MGKEIKKSERVETFLSRVFGGEAEDFVIPEGRYGDRQKAVEKVLAGLAERHRQVIVSRFGLNGKGEVKSRVEIGKELGGVNREVVKQIEFRALKFIRYPLRSVEFAPFRVYPEGSLLDTVYGFRYGFEFTDEFPKINLGGLKFEDLKLSTGTKSWLEGSFRIYPVAPSLVWMHFGDRAMYFDRDAEREMQVKTAIFDSETGL